MQPSPRTNAVQILCAVFDQQLKLSKALSNYLYHYTDPRDRSLVKEICFGVTRWLPRLEFILDQLVDKRINKKDSDIKYLIYSGLYQIEFLDIPNHAAVSESVSACGQLNKPWGKKLINAVLRRYLREHEQITARVENNAVSLYAHPQWLIETLHEDYPTQYQTILKNNNEHAPMYLRVNLLKTSRKKYLSLLSSANIAAEITPFSPAGIKLKIPMPIEQLPGFEQGYCAVQDLSAQLAANLLVLNENDRVLDACAAPGGKTALLLERYPGVRELVAIEQNETRYKQLKQSLARLNHRVTLIQADSTKPEIWWEGSQFDGILLDAPCSGTGVIRRQPDIKFARDMKQIHFLVTKQYQLLKSCWKLLKRGGRLLYATCSILTIENTRQIQRFLYEHKDCHLLPVTAE